MEDYKQLAADLQRLLKLVYYQRIDSMGNKVQDYLDDHNEELSRAVCRAIGGESIIGLEKLDDRYRI